MYTYKCTHIKGKAFYEMISVCTYVHTLNYVRIVIVTQISTHTYVARFVAKGDIICSSNSATLMSHNFVCD